MKSMPLLPNKEVGLQVPSQREGGAQETAPLVLAETGRTYWRGLDELAETPEFNQWLEREFPEGASEMSDPVSRRHFVRIMSASFLLAGFGVVATGCRRPEQHIVPFGKMPEHYV